MEIELIARLLEQLEAKQYTASIRDLSQNNKKLSIPGFSRMEKAPKKLVVNTAKVNMKFRRALLAAVSSVVLSGTAVNIDMGIDRMKQNVPKEKWLGLAALLLLSENEAYTIEVERIIDEYTELSKGSASVVTLVEDTKPDKREEKFREKYLKARKEMEQLKESLDQQRIQTQRDEDEIEELKRINEDLEARCSRYMKELNDVKTENEKLCRDIAKVKATITTEKTTQETSMLEIRVFAPKCKDILEEYCDILQLEFELPEGNLEAEIIEEYDEIWALESIVPFGMYRMLCKWKKSVNEKVLIFQTAAQLNAYVQQMVQAVKHSYKER